MKRKRLLIDINSIISYYTLGHTYGVGRSTFELLTALKEITDIPFDIVLFSQNIKGIGAKNFSSKFKDLHFYIPRRKPFTTIVNSMKLKKAVSGYDLMHIPHNTDQWEYLDRTIYTIHDLIVYRYPEMWGLTDKERVEHKRIADKCKAIVTCSEASRQDIINFWKCDPDKVTAIPWGVNRNVFSPDNTVINEIESLGNNFFFSASCNHPRKRTDLILSAFRIYKEQGGHAQLVLLSPSGKDIKNYADLISSGDILIVRGISDKVLVKLYTQAKASIVASLYEGFGLPVLESLACHTQVICAKNSSLIEAGRDIVDYLDELSEECLAKKMISYDDITKDNTLDIPRIEKHLSNFTWLKCAEKYIQFWTKQLNEFNSKLSKPY